MRERGCRPTRGDRNRSKSFFTTLIHRLRTCAHLASLNSARASSPPKPRRKSWQLWGEAVNADCSVCCAMLYFLETSFLEARRCKALPASAPWPLCRAWQRKCSLAALAKPSRRLPAEVHLGSRNFRQPSRMEYQAALDRCTRFPSPFSSAQQRRPDRGSTSEELTGPTENQMHTAVRRC